MSESGACLAITEKRPQSQRPGGCVGIFFQLFDWNRRFAKKKLFSKKLLAPAGAKQAAKKFGGDDKMPKAKLHLIADENSPGFSNMKKHGVCGSDSGRRHEMKAPSLVARLMGLESMPASLKHKKVLVPESVDDDGTMNFVRHHNVACNEALSLEKGAMKLESRPQKLQKTGAFERQAVTRFGAEAFQMKNVLSRSRKHQHPKLASPVKSPRASTGRSASRTRLIDVATRILEPGLQATNRARCSLTYPGSVHCSLSDDIVREVTRVRSPEPFNEHGCNASEAKPLAGLASCKNCGDSLDVMNLRSDEDDQFIFPSSAPNFVNASFLGKEKNAVLENGRDLSGPPASWPVENLQDLAETYREDTFSSRVGQERWSSPTKPGKSSIDETYTVFKSKTQDRSRMSLGKERTRRVSMVVKAVSEPKDFVSLNRNLSGRTQPRVGKSNLDNQRKSCDIVDDSLPQLRTPTRKRRPVNSNRINHGTGFARSKLENERNLQSAAFTRSSTRSIPYHQERSRVNENKNGDAISFSFNSPLRHKTGFTGTATTTSERKRDKKAFNSPSTSYQRKLLLDENNGEAHFQEPCLLRGDALSALLEQKLKELTSQEEDELTTGTSRHKKSTATILQELIAALNAEQPVSNNCLVSGTSSPSQGKMLNGGTHTSLRDGDHFSPGSVLEASFSNDSCFSSSIDENSVISVPGITTLDSTHLSHRDLQPLSDTDLSDSATSWNTGKACTKMASDLVNHISQVVQTMNLTQISHAREVIFNTELLFGNATSLSDPPRFLIGPHLVDELERFIHSTQPHYATSLTPEKNKEGLLRGFLSDSTIECLDSNYGSAAFKRRSRLPLHVSERDLIRQIDEDVRRWTEMAGKAPDEIVEWEMSHGLGKWIDFDAEVFENGEEIGSYILQNLVDEIVTEL